MSDRSREHDDGRDAASRLEDLIGRPDAHPDDLPPAAIAQDPEGSDQGQAAEDRADENRVAEVKPSPPVQADETPAEAPLFALLTTIERDVTVERIDRIWIFPPRRLEAGETAVVVVSAFQLLDPERRSVFAAHYTAPADAAEPKLALQEFGTAPADRVGRVVEDVVNRLKDEAPAAPSATRIEGDLERWHSFRHELAEKHLDETSRHPRLRTAPRQPPRPA